MGVLTVRYPFLSSTLFAPFLPHAVVHVRHTTGSHILVVYVCTLCALYYVELFRGSIERKFLFDSQYPLVVVVVAVSLSPSFYSIQVCVHGFVCLQERVRLRAVSARSRRELLCLSWLNFSLCYIASKQPITSKQGTNYPINQPIS
jgi:hypothetical protein